MSEVLPGTGYRLLALLAAEQAHGRAPSTVAGVVRDGGLVWSGSRGRAVDRDSGDGQPTANTQYRIGSITKVMTAVLVMQLRDEGLLSLSDRLDQHLPDVAYGSRTIRELLTHSSGIPAEPPGSWWERSPGVPFGEIASKLDDSSAAMPPGTQHHYSNLGYALLGEAVARLRGKPWFEVLSERLLEPLGMRRTSMLAEPPFAVGYSVDAFSGLLTKEPSHDSMGMAPAGQLWSTVEDLGRLAGFLADPVDEVLSDDSVREMATGQSWSPDDHASGAYGLGLRLAVAAERSYAGHTGSVPGFLAGLFVDRERKTGAVMLANAGSGIRAQGLPIDLLSELEKSEPTIAPEWTPTRELPSVVADVLGVWFWGNFAVVFRYEDGRIAVRALADGALWCTFTLSSEGRIDGYSGYFTGEMLTAVRRQDGSVGHLEVATFILTRTPYDPEAPIPGGSAQAPRGPDASLSEKRG